MEPSVILGSLNDEAKLAAKLPSLGLRMASDPSSRHFSCQAVVGIGMISAA
jgi:hypothetical protein